MTSQLIRLSLVLLCVMQEVETIVKASVMTPDTKAQIHMVQEPPETPECAISVGGGEWELGSTSLMLVVACFVFSQTARMSGVSPGQ